MAARRVSQIAEAKSYLPPATTPEAREQQLTGMAYDLVERQIREGTASSQVLSIFLKSGSQRERLEMEKLRSENEFLKAKVEAAASAKNVEALYGEALNAMRRYKGEQIDEEPDPYA